ATSLGARALPVFMVPCQEIGQGIPYATVSELITALGRDPAASGTEPLWLAEASRVCPGLRAIYPGIPPAPDAPPDSIRLRVAEAVIRMMEAVADNGPVLLAFDDLQFVDPASRAQAVAAAERSGDAGPISWTPPEDLRAAFARQDGGLSTGAQHVLQILSVAGKAMAPNELARLLGLQDGVVERAALEMLDR